MKRLIFIFIIAFVLNFIWENLHFVLYDNYLGGPVSRFILLQATVADAFLIVLLSLPFLYKNYFKNKMWLIIIFGIIMAVFIEWFALYTNWWQYGSNMPIAPILKVGISPMVQLGILGYFSLKLSNPHKKDARDLFWYNI